MEENVSELSSYECDGVQYHYLTPTSDEFTFDLMAKYIKTKDFNISPIAVVCEHADEAEQVMQQMGKRSVACLLLNKPNRMLDMIVSLLTEGLLNAVLVLCDDMLSPLAECGNLKIDLLIHFTEPLPHVFQKRIQTLIQKTGRKTKVMVFRSPTMCNKLQDEASATPLEAQVKETTSPPKATVKVEKTTQPPKIQFTPRVTNNKNIFNDSITSSKSESSDTLSEQLSPRSVYTYNNYGVFAQSQHELQSWYDISNITELNPDIKDAMMQLKIGDRRAKSVQRFAWPHVAQGRSLCVVANQQTGKTWCYLPWLCNRFLENGPQRVKDVGAYGPSCIVLCANAEKGNEILKWIISLTANSVLPMNRVITLFERNDVLAITAKLQRHPCGILITTVELMLQLCDLNDKEMPIFDPIAIRCFAIDDLCKIWRSRRMDCDKLIQWLFRFLRIEKDYTQLLIVGTLWCDVLMHRLLPKLPDVLLLFEDALEATVYFGIKLEMLLTDSELCGEDIIQIMKRIQLNKQRVILACASKKDANGLGSLLLTTNIKSILVSDNKNLQSYEQWCKKHNSSVLIATDEVIPKLRGDQIDCLVHCTPARSWYRFKMRFSLFYGSHRAQQSPKRGKSSILLSKNIKNLDNIWLFCNFMLKHDSIVSESWLTWLHLNRVSSEPYRNQQTLCRQLLVFGECWRRACKYRHRLFDNEIMHPKCYPKNYEIRFHIISVVSPSQLVVKMSKFELNNYFLGIPITDLAKNIQIHYQEPINRIQHPNPKAGDLCVIKLNEQYQRVVVKQVNLDCIEVKQVDAGRDVTKVKPSNLWVCEEHFRNEHFEATEMCITGLMPLNLDRTWPEDARHLIRKNFPRLQAGKPLHAYTAEVDFEFHDKLFVRNVFDHDGNDIKSLVVNNMLVHMDDKVINRLQGLFEETVHPNFEY